MIMPTYPLKDTPNFPKKRQLVLQKLLSKDYCKCQVNSGMKVKKYTNLHPRNLTYQQLPFSKGVTFSKSSFWVSMLVLGCFREGTVAV